MPHPVNLEQWLAECIDIPSHDEDNIMLFTGKERIGKSTLAIQLLARIDPTFDVTRISFRIGDFFPVAATTPKGAALLLDEARVNRRNAMTTEMRHLLNYLQVCGGLNHHVGLCFPRVHRLDDAIGERVRWNIDVKSRGHCMVRTWTGDPENPWRDVFPFSFGPAPDWIDKPYKAAKEEHTRKLLLESIEESSPEGVNLPALVEDFSLLVGEDSKHRST